MDYYDLKPTDDNLVKTFNEDLIGRNAEIFTFLRILDTVDGNYTISLDAPWGSGKTFFIKQVQMILNRSNEVLDESEKEKTSDKTDTDPYSEMNTRNIKLQKNHLAITFSSSGYGGHNGLRIPQH